MARPRGPILDYRPQEKTRVLLNQAIEVLDEYADHLPLTGRQVFYRLVGRYGFDKTEQAYGRLLEHLGNARRAGLIPWDSIRDDGVTEHDPWGYSGKPGFWATVGYQAEHYRRDRLDGQPVLVEVWAEAAGMLPQLVRVADPYGIAVKSSSGFDSITFKRATAVRAVQDGRPLVVLQVGDHDPSGVHVFSSAEEDVTAWAEDFARAEIAAEVRFVRVAVTAEQIARYNLPTAPAKVTDRRSFFSDTATAQCEALDPATLAAELTQAIEAVIDQEVLDALVEEERAERSQLIEATRQLGDEGDEA